MSMEHPCSVYQFPKKPQICEFCSGSSASSPEISKGRVVLNSSSLVTTPPGWTLVIVSCIARYSAICCKGECWMFNSPPELIFLTFWKQFSRPSSWECHLPNVKQITAALSSSKRTQLSVAEHWALLFFLLNTYSSDGIDKIQYFFIT